jgi:hypothetical protein
MGFKLEGEGSLGLVFDPVTFRSRCTFHPEGRKLIAVPGDAIRRPISPIIPDSQNADRSTAISDSPDADL